MNIREATSGDAEAIADIHIASWRFAYRGIMDDTILDSMDRRKKISAWIEAIDTLGWSVFVSEANGKITGFIHISEYRDSDLDTSTVGEIASLYISPELVGTGVGASLFSEGIHQLKQQGYANVALWVLEQNSRSIAFYEKFGFRRDGASKTHPKTGLKEVKYVR